MNIELKQNEIARIIRKRYKDIIEMLCGAIKEIEDTNDVIAITSQMQSLINELNGVAKQWKEHEKTHNYVRQEKPKGKASPDWRNMVFPWLPGGFGGGYDDED